MFIKKFFTPKFSLRFLILVLTTLSIIILLIALTANEVRKKFRIPDVSVDIKNVLDITTLAVESYLQKNDSTGLHDFLSAFLEKSSLGITTIQITKKNVQILYLNKSHSINTSDITRFSFANNTIFKIKKDIFIENQHFGQLTFTLQQTQSNQTLFQIFEVLILAVIALIIIFIFSLIFFTHKIISLDRSSNLLEMKILKRTTELNRQKALLINASKMATLGEISAGITHEINNPLAAISAHSFLIEKSIGQHPEAEKIRSHVIKIGQMVERISKIVSGFKSFARDGSKDPMTAINAQYFFEDIQELCSIKLRNKKITLQIVFPEDEIEIYGRLVQLSQVFINLISNSVDAIEALPERWIKIQIVNNQTDLRFIISDSGGGISPEIADKIMHPFFTTKNMSKGTGLGLSISLAIIKDHNGQLVLDKSAKNTTFVITLPKNI